MNLIEIYNMLRDTFVGAIPISGIDAINQDGLYLAFGGLAADNMLMDKCKYSIVLAVNIVNGDVGSTIERLQEIRKKITEIGIRDHQNYFRELKSAMIEGQMLYLYAFFLELEMEL